MNFTSLYDKPDDLYAPNPRIPLYEKYKDRRYDYDLYTKRNFPFVGAGGPQPPEDLPDTNQPRPNPMEKQPPRKSGLGARGQMNY